MGVSIQHIHYNTLNTSISGSEYRPREWAEKPVDGYYQSKDGTQFVFEFLGDDVHGHPKLWTNNPEAKNRFGKNLKSAFYETEKKMQKLASFGYLIFYIWETNYLKKTTLTSVHSLCKLFNGVLEH